MDLTLKRQKGFSDLGTYKKLYRAGTAVFLMFLATLGGMQAIARAGDMTIYPTLPGTSLRDITKPGLKIEGDTAYPTLPGTDLRDYTKPGFTIERDD